MIEFKKLQEAYGKNVTTVQLQKYTAMAEFCDQVGFRWSWKAEHSFLAALAGIVKDVQASREEAIHKQSSEAHTLQQMDKILVSCNTPVLFASKFEWSLTDVGTTQTG